MNKEYTSFRQKEARLAKLEAFWDIFKEVPHDICPCVYKLKQQCGSDTTCEECWNLAYDDFDLEE